MSTVNSFLPIIGETPKVLILGSSPGVISVKKQQYFAHPRNAFWPIMAELFDLDLTQGYDATVKQCRALPIIVWDVLKRCEREGSLDSAIAKSGLEVNDFEALFEQYAELSTVYCNGGAAFKWFNQLALPLLKQNVEVVLLPSTSPAHARINFQQKLAAWQVIKFSV